MTAFAVGMALVAGLSAFPVATVASAGTAKPSTSAAVTAARSPAGQPTTNADALPGMPDQTILQLRQPSVLAHRAPTRRALVPAALAPGTLSGTVRTFSGVPLASACVTAYGARGARSTKTAAGGGFVLPGLTAGRYTLEFRDCGHPGRYLPQWSGDAVLQAMATRIQVSSGKITTIAPANLRPASQAALFARPSAAQLARAVSQPGASRPAAASQPSPSTHALGGISGKVTGLHGRPVAHSCVEVHFAAGYIGVPVSSRGTYTTGRSLPPGRYTVEFAALDCPANYGNWAPQWYKDKTREAAAGHVTVRAGKTTRHIDARLRHGGIISGTVTGRAGAKVTGLCIGLFTGDGSLVAFREPGHRAYDFRGLPAGRYRVLFQPTCLKQSTYLSQWWKNKTTFAKADRIRVRLGKTVHHIDARLRVGGQITGTVRLGNSAGRPLRGICVDAFSGGALSGFDAFAPTDKNGSYHLTALPAGSYSIQFFPGCNNEGNFLSASYPHPVQVRDGAVVRHIDGVLQPGGVITGTVTDVAGRALANIAVFASTPRGNANAACTTKAGTFTITQLPPGHYAVFFGNDICAPGSGGNYAPQYYPNQPSFSSAAPLVLGPAQKVTGINAKMLPGSTISGTVSNRDGQPAGKVCVQVDQPAEAYLAIEGGFGDFSTIRTSDSGSYHARNLAAGRYVVRFTECAATRYADRWFGGRPGAPVGDTVNVGAGATVSGVGAVMGPGGAIAGTVRSAAGKPVSSSCEVITDLRTGDVVAAPFDSDSGYRVKGLAPGRYSVEFYTCLVGGTYATQWFNRSPGPRTATAVQVTARHTTTSVDAALPVGGQITGRLTDKATGKPVAGFCVEATTAGGTFFGFAISKRTGDYVIRGLNTGTYHLAFSNCFGAAATEAGLQRSRTVHVTALRTVSGINAALAPGGSIAGVVLADSADSATAAPQGDVCVEADSVSTGALEGSATSHTGHYALTNLPAGTYRVFFGTRTECDNSQNGLLSQWYKAAATRAAATTVIVHPGRRTLGISATLRADGGISGRVTAAPAGTSLAGICVRAVRRSTLTGTTGAGTPASFTASADADGGYSLTGLLPGRYTVRFSSGCGATGYDTRWWRDAATSAKANVITVHADTISTGIDIALTPRKTS